MALSGHSKNSRDKNTKNSDEEIEKLREILLKKEKKFNEELEKVGKTVSFIENLYIYFIYLFEKFNFLV